MIIYIVNVENTRTTFDCKSEVRCQLTNRLWVIWQRNYVMRYGLRLRHSTENEFLKHSLTLKAHKGENYVRINAKHSPIKFSQLLGCIKLWGWSDTFIKIFVFQLFGEKGPYEKFFSNYMHVLKSRSNFVTAPQRCRNAFVTISRRIRHNIKKISNRAFHEKDPF